MAMKRGTDEEMLLDKLDKLKRKEAEWREEAARLDGQAEQVLEQLKTKFGVSSFEEAKEKSAKLGKALRERRAALVDKINAIQAAVDNAK